MNHRRQLHLGRDPYGACCCTAGWGRQHVSDRNAPARSDGGRGWGCGGSAREATLSSRHRHRGKGSNALGGTPATRTSRARPPRKAGGWQEFDRRGSGESLGGEGQGINEPLDGDPFPETTRRDLRQRHFYRAVRASCGQPAGSPACDKLAGAGTLDECCIHAQRVPYHRVG